MPVHNPTWSYGLLKLYNSSGPETTPRYAWNYGLIALLHELRFPLRTFVAESVDRHFIAESVDRHFVAEGG